MRKPFRHCVLHIGCEKTGTSTIQRFLSENREAFIQEGVLYSKVGGLGGSQRWFETCAHSRPWNSDLSVVFGIRGKADQERLCREFSEKLEHEVNAFADCHTLVISSEHFHSRLKSEDEITRLKDLVSRWVEQFVIVLYVRRQDRVAVSLYSTKVKGGQRNANVFAYDERHLGGDGSTEYYFDYEHVYRNWSGVFGPSAMRVRVFEKERFRGGGLLSDFCEASGLSEEHKTIPPAANESLSQTGLMFMESLNKRFPAVVDGRVNVSHQALSSLVSKLRPGKSAVVTREAAMRFYDLYRESNERLKALAFPEQTAPLFDEDFTDYPESLEGESPCYDDAVDIAVEIWRAAQERDPNAGLKEELERARGALQMANAEIQFLRGQIALRNGNPEKGRTRFRKAIELNPEHAGAHLGLARLLVRTAEADLGWVHLVKAGDILGGMSPEMERLKNAYCGRFGSAQSGG